MDFKWHPYKIQSILVIFKIQTLVGEYRGSKHLQHWVTAKGLVGGGFTAHLRVGRQCADTVSHPPSFVNGTGPTSMPHPCVTLSSTNQTILANGKINANLCSFQEIFPPRRGVSILKMQIASLAVVPPHCTRNVKCRSDTSEASSISSVIAGHLARSHSSMNVK